MKTNAPIGTFGTGGNVLSDLGGRADAWFGVAISADGKSAMLAGFKGTDAKTGGNDDDALGRVVV